MWRGCHTWKGAILEGTPIEPDLAVEFDWRTRRGGRDLQLGYAIEPPRSLSTVKASQGHESRYYYPILAATLHLVPAGSRVVPESLQQPSQKLPARREPQPVPERRPHLRGKIPLATHIQ